jgi:FlaA1/EpsC-like NDP-sugar epimerase
MHPVTTTVAPPSRRFTPRGRHLFLYDLVAIGAAIVGAFALRFDASDPVGHVSRYLPVVLLPLVVQPLVNVGFGLYRREWRYASTRELVAVAGAVATGTVVSALIFLALASIDAPGTAGMPRSFFALEGMISLLLIGGGRFALRIALESSGRSGGTDEEDPAIRTLVYGAGEAGAALARLAARDRSTGIAIVGFLDDDPHKRGSRLHGVRIFGGLEELPEATRSTDAAQLIVAMPSAPGATLRAAVDRALELRLAVRVVPSLDELLGHPDRVVRVRPVALEDLLRRETVHADRDALAQYVNGASVLVTGGGGSIGSELVRQVMALGPRRMTILDNSEVALWAIERELLDAAASDRPPVDAVLADVRSPAGVARAIERAEPDLVFHAAALKHVPICEAYPSEAVLTNVVGTKNVVEACALAGVGQFVLISTDKAVHPVSIMGATKRLAELLTVEKARDAGRPYAAVRFGNVLGSSGSVIPIFTEQLQRGQPLTITHPDASRYFMTIPEAVTLILEAGSDAATGEIYLLDMGEPVRIVDLARDMVRLAGLPPGSVDFVYTGLRPGERLHETLLFDHETVHPTHRHRVLRAGAITSPITTGSAWTVADRLAGLAREADERRVRRLLIESGILQASDAVALTVG